MHRTEMLKLNNKSYEQKSLSMQASKNSSDSSSAVQCNVYCLHCELRISVLAFIFILQEIQNKYIYNVNQNCFTNWFITERVNPISYEK